MRLQVNRNREEGFTLIEIVVTLTLVSILGAYIILFATNAYEDSVDPVLKINQINLVESCMEDVNAAYFSLLNQTNVLNLLDTRILQILSTNPAYSSNITYASSFIQFTQDATDTSIMNAGTAGTGNNSILRVTLTYNADPPVSITELFYALK